MPGKYYMLHKIRTLRIVPNRTFTRESVEAHDRASKKLSLDAIYKGVATGVGGRGTGGPWQPHFNFRTKQGPTVSVSNIRDIAFLRVFRNYTDQKFHNLYRIYYNFWTN